MQQWRSQKGRPRTTGVRQISRRRRKAGDEQSAQGSPKFGGPTLSRAEKIAKNLFELTDGRERHNAAFKSPCSHT
jgi:hypothetical protein